MTRLKASERCFKSSIVHALTALTSEQRTYLQNTLMPEALDWLQNSFTARGTTGDSLSRSLNLNATRATGEPGNPWAFTPRPNAPAEQASATRASDDAVLAAAMSAVLSTPRGDVGGPSVVPDAVLGHGMSKMFKRQVL